LTTRCRATPLKAGWQCVQVALTEGWLGIWMQAICQKQSGNLATTDPPISERKLGKKPITPRGSFHDKW
jgi:hypothetical protein